MRIQSKVGLLIGAGGTLAAIISALGWLTAIVLGGTILALTIIIAKMLRRK